MTRSLPSPLPSSSSLSPVRTLLPLGMLLGSLCVLGCNRESTLPDTPPQDTPGLHDDHDHDHAGHDHEEHSHAELGPHGGHIIVLDPGHYHAEWVHLDEENIVEVYLGELAKAAQKVQFVAELEGKEPVSYELKPATESLGAGGYQLQSPNLLTHIAMSDGTTARVTLVVETEEATLKAPLSGDHDHDH